MNIYYKTFYSSYSKDKTDISSYLNTTHRLKNDFTKFKKTIKLSHTVNSNINNFHKNSIRTLVHKNLINKYYYSNEENENLSLPEFKKKKNNKNSNFNKIYCNSPFFHRSISNNSLITLSNFPVSITKKKFFSRNRENDFFQNINKSERTLNSYSRNYRREIIYKSKEMFFSNYLKTIQENEIKKLKNNIQTKNELYDVEIFRLKQMLILLKTFINEDQQYNEHLKITLKKEIELNNLLIEKKIDSFQETFLLRDRLGKIERKFFKYITNKYFLLCVKNGTNQINKFLEEDKNDYLLDLDTLEKLSNYSLIQYKLDNELPKDENFSGKEIEKFVFGRKLFKEQKNLFTSVKEFHLKLNQIENDIQNFLTLFNQSQKELELFRIIIRKKNNLLQEDTLKDNYFKEEIEKSLNKLKDLKFRNNHLKIYIKNLKKNINPSIRKNKLNLVKKKIIEMHKFINEKYVITRKRKFNEKITIITFLQDIEIGINKLILLNNQKKCKNEEIYLKIKKKIDKINKIKLFQNLKEQSEIQIQDKIKKTIEKSSKIFLKPYKKVPAYYNINNLNINKKETINNEEIEEYNNLDF